jgi:signal recognition particle GTPase
LKKGVNSFLRKISTYEINDDNIKKAIKEFRDLLISNDVSLQVAKQVSKKLTLKMKGKRAKRFSDLSKMIPEFAKPILIDIISPEKPINIIEVVENHKESFSRDSEKNHLFFCF